MLAYTKGGPWRNMRGGNAGWHKLGSLWFNCPASMRVGSRWGCATICVEACIQHSRLYMTACEF